MASRQYNMPSHYGHFSINNGNMQQHAPDHADNVRVCDVCNMNFPSQQELIAHIRTDPAHQQRLMMQQDSAGGNISNSDRGDYLLMRSDIIPDGASCPLCHVVMGREISYSAHIGSSQHTQMYLQEMSRHGPEQFYKSYGNVPYPDPPSGTNGWSPFQEKDSFMVYVIRSGFYSGFECKACVQQCHNLDEYRHHIHTDEHNHRTRYRAAEIGVENYRKMHFDVPSFCQERLFKGRTSLVFPPPGTSKHVENVDLPPTSISSAGESDINITPKLHANTGSSLSSYGGNAPYDPGQGNSVSAAYDPGHGLNIKDPALRETSRKRGHSASPHTAELSWDKRPRSSGDSRESNVQKDLVKSLPTSNMNITDLQKIISVATSGGTAPLDAAKVISDLQQQLKASERPDATKQMTNTGESSSMKMPAPVSVEVKKREHEQPQRKRETSSQSLSQETALLKALKETVIRTANRPETGPEQKAILLQMIKILEQQQVVIYDYKNQKQQIEKEAKQRREKEEHERRERRDKEEKERREQREKDGKFRKDLVNERKELEQKKKEFEQRKQDFDRKKRDFESIKKEVEGKNKELKVKEEELTRKKKKVPTATLR